MAATRITGKTNLVFELGGTDFGADVSSISLTNEDADSDVTTFADAAAGGAKQWYFEVTAVSGTNTGSLWDYLWTNSGTTVAYAYAPHGNATPSATQPHFTGSVAIGAKPPIGGEAGQTFTFDIRLDCTAEPTRATV